MNEASAFGPAKNIEVVETFHVGGLPKETLEMAVVKQNLKVMLYLVIYYFDVNQIFFIF